MIGCSNSTSWAVFRAGVRWTGSTAPSLPGAAVGSEAGGDGTGAGLAGGWELGAVDAADGVGAAVGVGATVGVGLGVVGGDGDGDSASGVDVDSADADALGVGGGVGSS